jgi:hypothetical protein
MGKMGWDIGDMFLSILLRVARPACTVLIRAKKERR